MLYHHIQYHPCVRWQRGLHLLRDDLLWLGRLLQRWHLHCTIVKRLVFEQHSVYNRQLRDPERQCERHLLPIW